MTTRNLAARRMARTRREGDPSSGDRIKRYFIEINRALGDDWRRVIRILRRFGLTAHRLPHKTFFRIDRPIDAVSFAEMKRAITACLDPRRGSVALFSTSTGRAWIMRRKGNLAGVFVQQ